MAAHLESRSGPTADLKRKASNDGDYVYGQLDLLNVKVADALSTDCDVLVKDVFMGGPLANMEVDAGLVVLVGGESGHCLQCQLGGERLRGRSWP